MTRPTKALLFRLMLISTAAVVVSSSLSVGQTTVTFRHGESSYSGAADTKILAVNPTTTYGSAANIELDGDSDKAGLLYWDLTSIPSGVIVSAVEIIANVIDPSSSTYEIYQSKRPWAEDSATWNEYTVGKGWQVAGAQGASDRDEVALGAFSGGSTGIQAWLLNAAGVAVVQGWIDDPASNLGLIVQDYTPTNGLDLDTREAATVANRPAISITYFAPGEQVPPSAEFTFDPPAASSGTSIEFDASASSDLDGFIADYDWDFGDGATGNGLQVSHVYAAAGSYTARLVVTDDDAQSDTTTQLVTIGPNGPATFAVLGDFGDDGPELADVAALVTSWNPDFIITAGDNNYPDGEASTMDDNVGKYFSDFIYPYTGAYGSTATMNRFYPSLGNHDWNTISCSGGACSGAHFDYFTLPGNERYYEFVWGDLHLFAIDSDTDEPDGTSSTSTQAQWLEARMAASTATWKVVYFHHAAYSSSSNHGSSTWMQWPFADWGADAVIAGHDHTYERIHRDGIVYFVNGLGGRSIYGLGTPIEGSAVQYNGDYGAMRAIADSVSLTFEFWNRADSLIDTFTLFNSPLLQVKAMLEGAFDAGGDSMSSDLGATIPLDQPYDSTIFDGTPLSYAGSETFSSLPAGAVDWVHVQLRTGDPLNPPMAVVASRAATLLTDGSLADTSGLDIVFPGVADGSYFLVLYHRNHLGVMSATAVDLKGGALTEYDFTAAASAYGSNPMLELEPGTWGMFAGDAVADGQIIASDFNLWLAATKNAATGYQISDHDLDGMVTASDFNLWLANTKRGAASSVP